MKPFVPRIIAISLVIVLLTLNLSACKKKAEEFTYKNNAPSTLAEQIAGGTKLKLGSTAVKEALSYGGIAVADGKGLLVRPAEPSASFYVLPVEAANLALDAGNPSSGYGLTLKQLGKMLADLGWPFDANIPPENQLVPFFSEWVRNARLHPNDDASFTPLFLAEMAKRKKISIDLMSNAYDPQQLRFSLLELQLIAGAFDRLLPHGKLLSSADNGLMFGSVAYAAEPCSDAKTWLGDKGGDAWQLALEAGQIKLSDGVGASLGAALKKLGMSEAGTDKFAKGMTSLGIVSKIWKLISIYQDGKVAVTLESKNPMQKSLPSEKEQLTAYRATAGVSDEDWKAYKDDLGSSDTLRSLRDCFGVVGLPTLPDLGDLAKDSANWSVEWKLPEGSPENGFISLDKNKFYLPGQLQMKLESDGDHSASSLLVVDLTPQKSDSRKGKKLQTKLTAEASLHTSSPPSLGTFVNAIKGGFGDLLSLADALVEIAGGWIQDMFQPKAYTTLNLEYYQSDSEWTGTASFERTRTDSSSSGEGENVYTSSSSQKLQFEIKLDKTKNSQTNGDRQNYFMAGQAKGTYLETGESKETSTEPTCGNGNTKRTITNDTEVTGSIQSMPIEGSLNIDPVQSDGLRRYQLSISVPGFPVVRTETSQSIIEDNSSKSTYCRSNNSTEEYHQNTSDGSISEGGIYSEENNGDLIQGTHTYKESGYDITVKWNFIRKEK
jgi:hypothetical protein